MADRYWDTRLETLPETDRRLVQHHRLVWQLRRCWDGSAFYRSRLEAAGLDPRAVGGPADLAKLPPLRFEELAAECRAAPPFGRLTVAPRDWWQDADDDPGREPPVRVATDGDVSHAADIAARALWAAGARPGGRIDLTGRLTGSVTADVMLAGARRIGMETAAHAGPPDQAAFTVTPSMLDRPGVDGRGVEEVSVLLGSALCVALGLAFVAPTLAYECEARTGLHWADDHFLVEIVDPESLQPRPAGAPGALLLTDLTREGSPLLRFWTGLEMAVETEPCPCGRTSARSPTTRPLP